MTKLRTLVLAILILAVGGTLLSLNGCGGTGGSPPPPPGKIHHVVVIFQENRTPDNLFQDPVLISKGADIAQSGKDSKGNTIPLQKVSLTADYNPGHGHDAFIEQCDLNSISGQCQMDGTDLNPIPCPTDTQDCTFTYVDPTAVQPYFRWLSSAPSPTACSRPTRGPAFRLTSSLFPRHRLHRPGAICLRRKIRTQTVHQTPDVTRPWGPRLR
jgi:hypothetical protein